MADNLNLDPAINDLNWIARRFQGIIDLLPRLEKLQSLENEIREKTKIAEALATKITEDQKRLDEITVNIRESDKLAQDTLQTAKEEAKGITAEARKKAQETQRQAQEKLNEFLAKVQAEKDGANLDLAKLREEYEALSRVYSSRQQQLLNIEEKIGKIRDTLNG